ncbi:MAG: DUF4097 family beta strand repeat protein [Oscillospiraceae bacterium]|nr:DUF4097 family beta strand repeat protein [Oscillospiraceae bacterium]
MTKGTKIVLIIAGICIALSIILLGVGAMLGGTRFADGIDTEIFGFNVHMGRDGVYAEGGNDGFSHFGEIESTGSETVATFDEDIRAVEINWVAGNIDFVIGGDVITVKEECFGSVDSDEMMSCRVENGTLKIGYSDERITFVGLDFSDAEKHLTVTVPEHLVSEITRISVDAVSSEINLGGFELRSLTINTVSGSSELYDITADIFEADTVSGNVTAAENCSFGKADIDTVSGSAFLSLDTVPNEFGFDSTSGNVTLELPADAEFELEFDRTSGELELEFAAVKRGDEYIVGSGRNEFSIETTSGDAIIRIK